MNEVFCLYLKLRIYIDFDAFPNLDCFDNVRLQYYNYLYFYHKLLLR